MKDNQIYLSDDVRKQNRMRILSQFRKSGMQSRTELGKSTELSPGSVTNITTQLLKDGIIEINEDDRLEASGAQGRPRVQLDLNSKHSYIIAGSVTFNRINLNLIDYSGQEIDSFEDVFDIGKCDERVLAERILSNLSSLPDTMKPSLFVIGVQGLTSKNNEEILWSPILNDKGRGFGKQLSAMSGAEVIVANDCAMIARSLLDKGSFASGSFATVLMSYGIGMALYLDGTSFSGSRSSAMEFGHIAYRQPNKGSKPALCRCGKRGCVEAYASDYAMWRRAYQKGDDFLPENEISRQDIAEIIEQARVSDGPAREALKEAGAAIGFGLAAVFNLFDPLQVSFVGRASLALDFMEDDIRKALAENYRFQNQSDVEFHQENEALKNIENGCAIIGLEWLDRQAAYGVKD